MTFSSAVQVMEEVLGPGSKILAAQDFRHTTQEDNESVSAFIRRLEHTYGNDKLGPETRGGVPVRSITGGSEAKSNAEP